MASIPNPWIAEAQEQQPLIEIGEWPRGFNVESFMAAIEPPPSFIGNPSHDYLEIVETLFTR